MVSFSLVGGYVHGHCYYFAMALHRDLGWKMVGLIHKGKICHTGVQDPEGNIWDARGKIAEEDFGSPFGLKPPYQIREVSEKELKRNDLPETIEEMNISNALQKAQFLFPELPWKTKPLKERIASFAEDLEKLSRKHGLWIYGSTPVALPKISEGFGDEGGYEIVPIMGGLSFMINRIIG